jgi:hypothetical protein
MAQALFQRSLHRSKKNNFENADDLCVIGAGLPRTGTSSLKAALEILGFGPCHHMTELVDKPDRTVQFIRALDGYKVDFYTLMKGYGSTTDSPTTEFYKEIHLAYPKAKIILTVRDSGIKWFESWNNTVAPAFIDNSYYFTICLLRFLRLQTLMCRKIAQKWTTEFGQIGPQLHDQYNARVINENKGGDILVFNVKEGWPPLCKFLGVDIPQNTRFPNVNDTEEFQRALAFARKIGWCAWGVVAIMIATAVYFIFRLAM